MAVGHGSTRQQMVARAATAGGTVVLAAALALAGAGTASAAPRHHGLLGGLGHALFGGVDHSQKNAEHQLGISGAETGAQGSHTTSTANHVVAKSTVSAEHNVGRTGPHGG